jgi:hypothetical protein
MSSFTVPATSSIGTFGSTLIVQIDRIHTETFERSFGETTNELRPAAHAAASLAGLGVDVPTELRRDHDAAAEGRERFTEEFLVCERAV